MTTTTPIVRFPVNPPAASQPALARLQAAVGAIPNLAAAMATSPALIEAFVALRTLFHQHSTLRPAERELVFLTNAVENGCSYCTAIHTAFALGEGVPAASVSAVRERGVPAATREAALVEFDRHVIRQRGRVEPAAVERFIAAGFTTAQALEIIAAAALSTLANYAGRMTQPPLDAFLAPHAVTAPSGEPCCNGA